MYPYRYIIPNNTKHMYRTSNNFSSNNYSTNTYSNPDDERFFLAPFLVGGIAGTALGYGIANNNQMNRPPCCGFMPYPVYPAPYSNYPMSYSNYPTYSNSNNFYY